MGTRLAGQVAIVTGSGQGIAAPSRSPSREGVVVVIATRTAAHGEGTLRLIEAEGGKAIFQQVDIADNDATHAMVNEAAAACGRLDIMVHNAAAFGRSSIQEMDHATLDRLFNINVKACFTLTQASLPHMRKQGAGRIIITSSVTGPKVSMPGSGAYAVSKAAVTGFIHIAAIELAPDNITVNAIEPGYIDTPGLSGLKARFGAERIFHFIQTSRSPGRDRWPDGFQASYITGETIVVDGGARLPESPLFAG